MQSIEVSELRDKISDFIQEDEDYQLCSYGILANDKMYYYGYSNEKKYFIVDMDGTLVSKEEALQTFDDFIYSWAILTDNLNHFIQCANKRPLSMFEKLSYNINKFSSNKAKIRGVEDEVTAVKQMLATIFNGQEELKEKIKEAKEFKDTKFEESLHFTKEDIKQLILFNSQLNWILYLQAKSINESIEPMKKVYSYLKHEFGFVDNYLNFTHIALKQLLNHFTSETTINQNKESLKSFEENHNGNYVSFPNSEIGFTQFHKQMKKNFENEFNSIYVSNLYNH